MSFDIKKREQENYEIFKRMSKNIHKDSRDKDWPQWKFDPPANFWMQANSRDFRFKRSE